MEVLLSSPSICSPMTGPFVIAKQSDSYSSTFFVPVLLSIQIIEYESDNTDTVVGLIGTGFFPCHLRGKLFIEGSKITPSTISSNEEDSIKELIIELNEINETYATLTLPEDEIKVYQNPTIYVALTYDQYWENQTTTRILLKSNGTVISGATVVEKVAQSSKSTTRTWFFWILIIVCAVIVLLLIGLLLFCLWYQYKKQKKREL